MAKTTAAKTTKKEKKLFYTIAAKHIYSVENRGDLEAHRSDEEDFIETSVWGLEAALEAAYRAGQEAGRRETK